MPGNFYSETERDELRRVKAELSAERALVAGLALALDKIASADGIRPGHVAYRTKGELCAIARSALSELEKSK